MPVGPAVTATGNAQSLTGPTTAAWGPGPVSLRVEYSGSSTWYASTSTTLTVTVQTATTIGLAYVAGTPGTLTATVGPTGVSGTVTFYSGNGAGTKITGCIDVAVAAETATCSTTQASGTKRAGRPDGDGRLRRQDRHDHHGALTPGGTA